MGKIAFVFAGQGAQYTSMGKELYQLSDSARQVFDIADRIRPGTSAQCFEASKQELSQTINTQPCMFCVDLAAALTLKEKGLYPDMVAGFSLGEIPALAFAGAISIEDAFRLVIKRAELMQQCAQDNKGAMAAILGLDNEEIEHICDRYDNVYPVNYNCPKQLVIAGEITQLNIAIDDLKKAGARALMLPVNGAFHSPFMTGAYLKLTEYVKDINIGNSTLPVYVNATALPRTQGFKEVIPKQVISPVLWQKIIENMSYDNADTFIEVGPGKTLSNLIRKINPTAVTYNVQDRESFNNVIEHMRSLC